MNREFEKAKYEFLSSLPRSHHHLLGEVTTAESFLDGIYKLKDFSKRKTKGKRLQVELGKIVACLEPYFDVVNTLVSSHPEFAALAWGALKLMFQVTHIGISMR